VAGWASCKGVTSKSYEKNKILGRRNVPNFVKIYQVVCSTCAGGENSRQ